MYFDTLTDYTKTNLSKRKIYSKNNFMNESKSNFTNNYVVFSNINILAEYTRFTKAKLVPTSPKLKAAMYRTSTRGLMNALKKY